MTNVNVNVSVSKDMYVTFDGTNKAFPVNKQKIKTIAKDNGWVTVLTPFNMEEEDNEKKKNNNTAMKYLSMSMILDAQNFHITAGNNAYKVWTELYKTFNMKGIEDLLRLMTKFASCKPELHLRPRIWYLHLDMKRQEI